MEDSKVKMCRFPVSDEVFKDVFSFGLCETWKTVKSKSAMAVVAQVLQGAVLLE